MVLEHPHVNEEVEDDDDEDDDDIDVFKLHFEQCRRSISSIHDQSTSEHSDDCDDIVSDNLKEKIKQFFSLIYMKHFVNYIFYEQHPVGCL